jgi:hypothetical protein
MMYQQHISEFGFCGRSDMKFEEWWNVNKDKIESWYVNKELDQEIWNAGYQAGLERAKAIIEDVDYPNCEASLIIQQEIDNGRS